MRERLADGAVLKEIRPDAFSSEAAFLSVDRSVEIKGLHAEHRQPLNNADAAGAAQQRKLGRIGVHGIRVAVEQHQSLGVEVLVLDQTDRGQLRGRSPILLVALEHDLILLAIPAREAKRSRAVGLEMKRKVLGLRPVKPRPVLLRAVPIPVRDGPFFIDDHPPAGDYRQKRRERTLEPDDEGISFHGNRPRHARERIASRRSALIPGRTKTGDGFQQQRRGPARAVGQHKAHQGIAGVFRAQLPSVVKADAFADREAEHRPPFLRGRHLRRQQRPETGEIPGGVLDQGFVDVVLDE